MVVVRAVGIGVDVWWSHWFRRGCSLCGLIAHVLSFVPATDAHEHGGCPSDMDHVWTRVLLGCPMASAHVHSAEHER
jgi:hypothetical protein